MKGLILLLTVYSLETFVFSDNGMANNTPSILLRIYPKKVHPIKRLPQKLINSGRLYSKTVSVTTRKPAAEMLYTAFTLPHFNAPDSPLFPLDFNIEQKTRRIKKTLRSKRSAVNITKNTPVSKVAEVTVKSQVIESKPVDIRLKNDVNINKPKENKLVSAVKKEIVKPKSNVTQNHAKVANARKTISKPVSKKGVLRNKLNEKGKTKGKKNTRRQKVRSKRLLRNGTKLYRKTPMGKKRHLRSQKWRRTRTNVKTRQPLNKTRQVRKESRRLIAARDAKVEDYPYVASIQKDGEHWCSGALLNRRLIISTANCFWKSSSISRLKVRVGSRSVDQGGQVTRIQEVMKHPSWSIRKNPDNDLALALLDRIVRFSDAVHAVDLPNRVMLPPFDDAWVTSFGAERRDGVYNQHELTLQVYHVRLMDFEKCNNITQRFGVAVTENFICLSQSGRRSPCTRDTGAPAVSDGIVWGLASWGIRKLCGTERFPAMFSYVASQSNMDFVINATRFLMSEKRENPMLDRFQMNFDKQTGATSADEQ